MVINFYLTRHGETQWNKIGKFQGQFDSPLTEKGLLQAESIAEQLTNKNIHLIVSSTLPRAKKTAEICQATLQLPHKLTSTLIERNFGSWQGKYIEEVKLDKHLDLERKFARHKIRESLAFLVSALGVANFSSIEQVKNIYSKFLDAYINGNYDTKQEALKHILTKK